MICATNKTRSAMCAVSTRGQQSTSYEYTLFTLWKLLLCLKAHSLK